MKNILFFGDSLTAGYGLNKPAAESFPALINQKITEEGLSYRIINAGKNGDTTAGGLNRLNFWLNINFDVFVLELGINDLTWNIPPEIIYQNLETIVKTVKLKQPDAKLALMGMDLPSFMSNGFIMEFKAMYKKLAEDHDMAFVPFFLKDVAGIRNLNIHDGLHPSAEGYQVIAKNVWPVLKSLLVA